MQLPEPQVLFKEGLQVNSSNESPSHKFSQFREFGFHQPSYQQQKEEIYSHLKEALVIGQKWCLIHISWYKRWKIYVGFDNWDKSRAGEEAVYPGPIDNTALMDDDKLRMNLRDEIDYKLVPEVAWNKLLSWYGISEGSMKIRRQVVEYGKFIRQCKVKIYPLELKCHLYPNEKDFIVVLISRVDTILTLVNKIRNVYNIDSKKQTRIYSQCMTYTYELITDLNEEVQLSGLFLEQHVLLEVQNEDGTWPKPLTNTKGCGWPRARDHMYK